MMPPIPCGTIVCFIPYHHIHHRDLRGITAHRSSAITLVHVHLLHAVTRNHLIPATKRAYARPVSS